MKTDKQTMTQSHDVEARLRAMILDMEIGPGERLTERWAEAQLGASRTPIRAALLRLEADGLVGRDGRGWIVPPLDVHEIEQLFVYREVLETAALRLAAGRIDDAVLNELQAQLDTYGPGMSKEKAHEYGTAFHLKLAELSGNDFINRGIVDAITRLSRARWLDIEAEHDGWDEHRAIIAALQAGDTESAVKLVASHIRESRDRLLKVLRAGRRSFRSRGALVT
ncbi:GntR family transcriptional regulator [Xanthobacter sediminis]|uniref:GntR family transcriptional regulator n=1 Tax=Xanthobacter sediminis TaxID=3119926 RepID=UPI00372C7634